jgi:DNA-binding NarL/FixJ family response regulator
MDISMPGMNGLDALGIIHARFPKLPVLMHSMYLEEQYAARAKRLGAAGYLSKNAPAAKILDAVKSAARGEYGFSKSTDSLP